MTLRARVLATVGLVLVLIGILSVGLADRYGQARSAVNSVVDTIGPAAESAAGLSTDIANMDRELRIHVSTGAARNRALYESAVVSAALHLHDLDVGLGGDPTYAATLADLAADLTRWITVAGDPTLAAMEQGDPAAAQQVLDSPEAQTSHAQLSGRAFQLSADLRAQTAAGQEDSARAARELAIALGLALAVLLMVTLLSYVALRRGVLRPIDALRQQLRVSATPEHHDTVIVPVGPPELSALGTDAEALRRALVREIDAASAARAALEQEGPVVDAIRTELAPRADLASAGVLMAGMLRPAEGVLAGDFWDGIPLGDGRTAAIVCDVSGHGPRAGIVAMRIKTSISLGLMSGTPLPEMLHRACDTFAEEPGRFATLIVIVADPSAQRLTWVNAGHPAARVIRVDGTIERLDPTGPMVSWLLGSWTVQEVPLGVGDVCVALTDGVLESRDEAGDELGDDGLDERLAVAVSLDPTPDAVIAHVLAGVRDRAVTLGRDDVTLVAMRLAEQ